MEFYKKEDNPYIKYLTCPICDQVFQTPVRLHRCGHTFCDKCCPITVKKCPDCRANVSSRQPDLTASNLVADLVVKCTAADCPFLGRYEDFINKHNNCTMRKHGGIEQWVQSMRNSLNTYNKKDPNDIRPIFPPAIQIFKENPTNFISIDKNTEQIIMVQDDGIPFQQFYSSRKMTPQPRFIRRKNTNSEQPTFIECIDLQKDNPISPVQRHTNTSRTAYRIGQIYAVMQGPKK